MIDKKMLEAITGFKNIKNIRIVNNAIVFEARVKLNTKGWISLKGSNQDEKKEN